MAQETCTRWVGAVERCGGEAIGRWEAGWRCCAHSPAALAGEPEPPAGPGWVRYRSGLAKEAGA